MVKNKTDETSWEFIEVIEGKEEYISHAWGINLGGIAEEGDTLIFSFNTNPNGLMEVHLVKYSEFDLNLFTDESVDNYEIILPDNSCTLRFTNLETFDIILTLNFIVRK